MKTLITLFALVTTMNVMAAPRLKCGEAIPSKMNGEANIDEMGSNIIGDRWTFECTDKNGYEYLLTLKGRGIALEYPTAYRHFTITCPFLKHKNIYGTYHGVRVHAGIIASLGVGVNIGKRGKTCFLGQVSTAVGGSVVYDTMTIKDKWASEDYEETVIVE